MALFEQNSRHQTWLFMLFFTLFVHPALANDGDDFINNLLTDIAPILALFGERVTMQFLSQSFSILDCIIFAACPIGIVTATVSAIRVAAPNSWRSLIGRAMESRAATELELLSSTSPDVCELWSGSALVRVMGSPGILELLYFSELDTPDNVHCGLFTLNEKTENRPQVKSQWLSMGGKKLQRQSPFEGKGTQPGPPDNEAMKPSDRNRQASPSISMNLSSFYNGSRLKLRLMTIFGVLVQLCVVGYGAMITYYGPWKPHFTKDEGPVVPAAFPLMTSGTIMVSVGMFICALVIEKCTTEIEWKEKDGSVAYTNTNATANQHEPEEPKEPKKGEVRLLWLQKHKIVNDQAFKSCAILARRPRTRLLTSDMQAVSGPLELGSMVGVLVSLVGFVLQFSGLRFMNWSATLAQLLGMAIMTVMRAYLRIGLVDQPKTPRAVHDCELDWLASQFVVESKTLWEGEGEKVDEAKPKPPAFLWMLRSDEELFEQKREGQEDDRVEHGEHEERQMEEEGPRDQEGGQHRPQQEQQKQQHAIRLWRVRQRLGFLSPWTSDYVDISKAVSLAIESVMGILLANTEAAVIDNSFRWSLKGIWLDGEEVPFAIPLGNEERYPWGSPGEIEAALSIWSYFLVEFPEDRKVVRSLEHCGRTLRQDITLWAGQKETGLLLFDLVEEQGQSVPPKPLSSSTRPLGTLLAQRIFLWFMLDLTESLSSRLPKVPTVTFLDHENPAFKGVHLKHPTLTAMVQKIEQSGLASAEEAWDMVILPLSFHQKLPSPMAIIEEMRDRSKHLEQTGQWTQVLKIQEQMVEVCKGMNHEVETNKRAAAIVIDTYRRISTILDVETQQFRREQHLTQLQQVEQRMREMISDDLDARIVQALLKLYKLQEPQGSCPDPVRKWAGRFGKTFNDLAGIFEGQDTDNSLSDVAQTIQDLPNKFEFETTTSDDLLLYQRLVNFDWKEKSARFPDPLGLTLAHYVMIRGVRNVDRALELVAPNNDPVTSASDIAGWTSLHYASMSREAQGIHNALWRYGGSVHARSRDGMTPLHCLARTGTHNEVIHLLDLGATPTAQDNSSYTPLHWAAWCGNVGAIAALLSKGADPGSRDNYGRTALHLATIGRKVKAVAVLSGRTDIDAQDVDGNTALHYAALLGNRSLLSEGNSECSVTGEDGVEEAGQEHNRKTVDGRSHGGEEDALVRALFIVRDQAVKGEDNPSSVLRNKDGDCSLDVEWEEIIEAHLFTTLQIPNVDGNAPIHVAIERGHLRVVERLLGPGEQSHKTAYGMTPLRLAIVFGRSEVVRRLLEAGADDDLSNLEPLFKVIRSLSIRSRREGIGRILRLETAISIWTGKVRSASPFFPSFMSRLTHRMEEDEECSIKSLQEAYNSGQRARTLTGTIEEYIKNLEEIVRILETRE